MKLLKNFYKLLDKNLSKSFLLLIIFMIIGTLLEVFSIALIVPVLGIIVDNEFAQKYELFRAVLEYLGQPSDELLVLYVSILFLLIYFVKASFLTFLSFKEASFIFKVQGSLSERLFSIYLSQPYSFNLDNNSSTLFRNINSEVSTVAGLSSSLTAVMIECLVAFTVICLLIIMQPLISIILIVLMGGIGLLFYIFTRNRLLNWGHIRQKHEGYKIQHLQQGFGAIKDIKIYGREKNFLDQFSFNNSKSILMGLYSRFTTSLPRMWMEFFAIICLFIVILTMYVQGKNIQEFITVLGLFLAAAFRIMPSFNRIVSGMQNIRYGLAAMDKVINELNLNQKDIVFPTDDSQLTNKQSNLNNSIHIKNVSFSYPNTDKTILRDINFKILRGTSIGLIGQSGAGKSTLIDIILGLLEPTKGEVLIDERSIHNNLREWQNSIGYVPQNIYLTDDKLVKNIAFGISDDQINFEKVNEAVKKANLKEFIDGLTEGLDTYVGEVGVRLSGGQRQRIGIARAFYNNPSILVLDEATSALDLNTEEKIIAEVSKLSGNKTILIISHRINSLKFCDKIFEIKNTSLVEGSK